MCNRKGYIRSETYRVTTAGIPCGMTCDPNYRARIELLVNPTGHGPSASVTAAVVHVQRHARVDDAFARGSWS